MRTPTHGPVWRAARWMLLPLLYPDYRRLLIRTCILSVRLGLLQTLFAMVAPFATPGLLLLLRRWFENLRSDVTEFGCVLRARNAGHVTQITAMPSPAAMPPVSLHGEWRNPWI